MWYHPTDKCGINTNECVLVSVRVMYRQKLGAYIVHGLITWNYCVYTHVEPCAE